MSDDDQLVTRGFFALTLEHVGRGIADAIRRNLAPLSTRVGRLENVTGAISMLVSRGKAATDLPLLDGLIARVDALERLEARIKALEARPALQYLGIWTEGDQHREGDFVTYHGSLWHCNAIATQSRPGDGDAWQLAVKRGANGRD